ncbi:reverse transcriptase domain-containing protein [Tanacetum coccineum]
MRTRSQARKRRQQQVRQTSVESPNLEKPNNNQETFNPPIVTMADNRTMAQLLEAPTEGYEDAIVVPEITANNFEIKHGLLNLVQNKQFFGHDKEDPHAHIRYFNKITSTMKFPNVPSTSVKLMLFPFSLEGAARIWLEKEPPRSILTWDDLVSKFINKFFPPSKTTNLRNEITRFQQKFDETFYEAWDRFNDLLRGCPHHGFSELHQLDTFYNALNSNDQDSLNSAAGGNFASWVFKNLHQIVTFYNALIQMSRFIELAARWDDTVYLEELLSVINSDPNLPPSPVCEINVPEKGDDKLPVIIAKNLKDEDKTALIKVLKSHKRAIAWKISDIKGINPQFCTHKILMEENAPTRRLIYPISDSPWVSPVHCVPKKGGITVVKNEDNELIPTRLVTGWRVCIDYRKLNDATRKDHFPLPFMDQMLERLAGNEYYCFLDGFSGYFQIPIDPLDQEKTTFTCPYGTFAYRRMPFGLCNAPGTFQRCMVAIFHDMIEKTMEFHG